MRKLKYIIFVVILFITIGFATINYTLSIDGDTELTGDLSDFKVYYSELKINGLDSPESIISDTELYVSGVIDTVGDTYTVDYDITNASKLFDANIRMNCTASNDYLSVVNNFDTENVLTSLSTRSGTLTFTKIKTIASTDSFNFNVSCKFVASPIEREITGSGSVDAPLNPYYIGREVAIGSEKFNIISDNGTTITMLTQQSIGLDFKQSSDAIDPAFSGDSGWEYSPGPKEIDVQTWGGGSKGFLNNYVAYLKELTGDQTIQGDFITLKQLESLGCIIADDYTYSTDEYCGGSLYRDWLIIDKYWWTKSASSEQSHKIWAVGESGYMRPLSYDCGESSVRPVVTISKTVAEQLLRVYPVGKEIAIGTEKFNVISDNGTTVSMLAQYNVSDSNYRQSTKQMYTVFSDTTGWEYTPGPKEIDIQTWGGSSKTVLNSYVSYLNAELGENVIESDFITLSELKTLGCTINDDYSYSRDLTCVNSPYDSWLVNGQMWWTKSAYSTSANAVWGVSTFGVVATGNSSAGYGVRPVITISKEILNVLRDAYPVGQEISIGTEKFNVINDNGNVVTMLAQYNLDRNYRQNSSQNMVSFSSKGGWEYTPGPKDIDIQTWSSNPKTYISEYITYLSSTIGSANITGDLITLSSLSSLGCTINADYSYTSGHTCANSPYVSWLVNGQYWWTRSAGTSWSMDVWAVYTNGALGDDDCASTHGIRPIIIIPKSDLEKFIN